MARYGMLLNTRRCIGCFACRLACQMANEVPSDTSFIRYTGLESGTYPEVKAEQVMTQCQHCEDAPCVHVCPTGASHINADGVVLIDTTRCIGCRYCVVACPYDARVIDKDAGVAEKCSFCVFTDDGSVPQPNCERTCVTRARIFGDLDDPESDISKAIVKFNAKPLAGELTKSKFFYVR
ncbi:MAG: 4Fe-4S dicluster domain-containing protein [Coriobacteriia bacterium]|nr:4Fe-4S dicluster domain-containing protein [Coriobacteriia bacterium]